MLMTPWLLRLSSWLPLNASERRDLQMTAKGEPTKIHPTAIIHPGAELAADVVVGPYSVIDEIGRASCRERV